MEASHSGLVRRPGKSVWVTPPRVRISPPPPIFKRKNRVETSNVSTGTFCDVEIMKIKKIGHCCLVVEEGGARFLTDPGNFSDTPDEANIHAILITHEHQDHLHIPALKSILENNPEAVVITHGDVGKILSKENIEFQIIEDGGEAEIKGVSVKSFGTEHACIHKDFPVVRNTGFMIAGRLFYPGDSLHEPNTKVEILALPVAGPWVKIGEAVDYAVKVKPEVVFPVHDGMLRPERVGSTRRVPAAVLEPLNIRFVDIVEGTEVEF